MMNCWKTLNIESTRDRKLIKKAYARKLKVNRPDDNPEAFRELHDAYQLALSLTQETHSNSNQRSDSTSSVEQNSASDLRETLNEHSDHENDELNQAWQRLTQKVHSILAQPDHKNNKESWLFLENEALLYNIELKNSFSFFIFYQLIQIIDSDKKAEEFKTVFCYLNVYFDWHYDRFSLQKQFGYEAVEFILDIEPALVAQRHHRWISPKHHSGKMIMSSYIVRIFSGLLDIGLFYIPFLLIEKYFYDSEFDSEIRYASFAVIGLVIVIMESSPLQATLGKLLFGIKVVNRNGIRLTFIQAMLRLLSFTTSMLTIILIYIGYLGNGVFAHDKLSRSFVIRS